MMNERGRLPERNPLDPEQEAAIARYLTREMSAEERAAMERRMAAEPDLSDRVRSSEAALRAAAEWTRAPAPGAGRVEALPVPSMPAAGGALIASRPRRVHRAAWLGRAMAAAAIFAAGFGLGRMGAAEPAPGEPLASSDPAHLMPSPMPAVSPAGFDAEPGGDNQKELTPEPGIGPATRIAGVPPRILKTAEGEPLMIETTEPRTGARAVWIVRSDFRLTRTNNPNDEGDIRE